MSPSDSPLSHGHLSAESLWDWAEVLAAWSGLQPDFWSTLQAQTEFPAALTKGIFPFQLPNGFTLDALRQAKACPLCGPQLEQAVRQLASLRHLPEVKAPPDFLALVQQRLAQEPTWMEKLSKLLFPEKKSGLGLPVGFASALLLIVVLVVVLPRSPLREMAEPTSAVAPAPASAPPHSLDAPASQPEEKAMERADKSDAEPETRVLGQANEAVSGSTAEPKAKRAPAEPKPPPAAPAPAKRYGLPRVAAKSPSSNQTTVSGGASLLSKPAASPAPGQMSPASTEVPQVLKEPAPSSPVSEVYILQSESKEPEGLSWMESPILAASSSEKDQSEAEALRDNLTKGLAKEESPKRKRADQPLNESALDTLPDFRKTWHHDTLWVEGRRSEYNRLKLWLESKQWSHRAEISFSRDSVQARIRP